jgi:protein SCO1/2
MAQVTIVDRNGRVFQQVYGATFAPPQIVEPLKQVVFGRERSILSLDGLSDRIKLFCTVYNPNTGRYYFNYSLFASIAIGALSLLAVFLVLIRETRKSWKSGQA